jgi:transposase
LWAYVRDERPHGGARPPAAVFFVLISAES